MAYHTLYGLRDHCGVCNVHYKAPDVPCNASKADDSKAANSWLHLLTFRSKCDRLVYAIGEWVTVPACDCKMLRKGQTRREVGTQSHGSAPGSVDSQVARALCGAALQLVCCLPVFGNMVGFRPSTDASRAFCFARSLPAGGSHGAAGLGWHRCRAPTRRKLNEEATQEGVREQLTDGPERGQGARGRPVSG